jgi:hypothetical protein
MRAIDLKNAGQYQAATPRQYLSPAAMEFSERERQIILLALHDLMIARDNFAFDDGTNVIPLLRISTAEIEDLAIRLDGDTTASWFGATLHD